MPQEGVLQANFDNVCRFCLSGEGCVPLFIGSLVNDYLMAAIDLLLLKIDENDGLPNAVCENCYRVMAEYTKFEATAMKTRSILTDALSRFECAEEAKEEPTAAATSCTLMVELLPSEDDGAIEEPTCSDSSKAEMEDDVTDELEEFTEAKPTVRLRGTKRVKQASSKKQCPVCGKHVTQLSKHMPMHTGRKKFRCEYCKKQFAYCTSLHKHLKIHRDIRNYRCQYCEESFCDRSSLRYHEAKHRGERNFVCCACGRSFYTSSRLKQHLDLAHHERVFRCDLCGKIFHMKHHLEDHLLAHSDERPHICTLCGKGFKRSRNLQDHMKTHR